jgi:hypothetical protein
MKTSQNLSVDSSNPQAWIAVQKNRQKVYDSNGKSQVYLKDGQEFQIELFNPTQTKYVVKFKINGKYPSVRGLILNPGQRYFLDRFIDENRKLSFSTYEVEDSSLVKKAIENNGLLEVEFYAESTYFRENGITWTNHIPSPFIFGSGTTTLGNTSYLTNGNFTLTGGVSTNTASFSNVASNNSSTYSANHITLETGRVEKGETSNQTFENGFVNYSSWVSHSQKIQIIPISQKPVETHEIRNYCSGCGNRVKKQTWKFCPSCGEKF